MPCRIRSFLFLCLVFAPSPLLAATNISVPFTSQAPLLDWRQPWQDACEETVIAMVGAFYQKTNFANRTEARDKILAVFAAKEKSFGKSLDETADTMVKLINSTYQWRARVVVSPSITEMKAEIDANRPIILPASGVELRNPHFRSWPNFHTIVISGYDDETREFITQEPGTRFGLDFRYSYDRILDAMHDFVPNGETPLGSKVAIFTMTPDVLMKAPQSAKVYKWENGKKRHITSEAVFDRHGWKPSQITLVSARYLDSLTEGSVVE